MHCSYKACTAHQSPDVRLKDKVSRHFSNALYPHNKHFSTSTYTFISDKGHSNTEVKLNTGPVRIGGDMSKLPVSRLLMIQACHFQDQNPYTVKTNCGGVLAQLVFGPSSWWDFLSVASALVGDYQAVYDTTKQAHSKPLVLWLLLFLPANVIDNCGKQWVRKAVCPKEEHTNWMSGSKESALKTDREGTLYRPDR